MTPLPLPLLGEAAPDWLSRHLALPGGTESSVAVSSLRWAARKTGYTLMLTLLVRHETLTNGCWQVLACDRYCDSDDPSYCQLSRPRWLLGTAATNTLSFPYDYSDTEAEPDPNALRRRPRRSWPTTTAFAADVITSFAKRRGKYGDLIGLGLLAYQHAADPDAAFAERALLALKHPSVAAELTRAETGQYGPPFPVIR